MPKLRSIGITLLVAGALALPVFASAQTVASLQQQLQALLAQLASLQQNTTASSSVAAGTTNAPSQQPIICPALVRTLSVGSTGTDVANLQGFLAQNPLIYPEGSVTAYFGRLTQDAVQRWQSAYHIVSSGTPATTGYGVVGPHTRAAIAASCVTSGGSSSAPLSSTQQALCPIASQPATLCAGTWSPVTNTTGCTIAWQCAVPVSQLSSSGSATQTTSVTPITSIVNPTMTSELPVTQGGTTTPIMTTGVPSCLAGATLINGQCVIPASCPVGYQISGNQCIPGRVVVPITQRLFGSTIRYSIPVTIGSATVQAMLDTGSTGFRILSAAMPASNYTATTLQSSIVYGGPILKGIVADAIMSIGGIVSQEPIEIAQSITCKDGDPGCDTADIFGYQAIIGISMKGADVPNPLIETGSAKWLIELPLPGASAPGALIINPSANDIAGYTLFNVPQQTTDDVGTGIGPLWADNLLPICVTRNDKGISYCYGASFDSGAFNINPVPESNISSWNDGVPATISVTNSAGTTLTDNFTVGAIPGSHIYLDQDSIVGLRNLNTGPLPFFNWNVLYEFNSGIMGLKAR
jgi:peptidoglycan hydrolase-like protein with peptidoglycan-binding domain